jgi:hypothetical protein
MHPGFNAICALFAFKICLPEQAVIEQYSFRKNIEHGQHEQKMSRWYHEKVINILRVVICAEQGRSWSA